MRTVAQEYADLVAYVSLKIEEAKQEQEDKTQPLSPYVVWIAAADWVEFSAT